MTSVVIGDPADAHAQAVVDAIHRRDCGVQLFDASTLSVADVVIMPEGVVAEGDRRLCGRGWIRRLAPEGWREVSPRGGHEDVVRSAWVHALTAAIDAADVEWLSPLRTLFDAENKLRQYRVASELGIRIAPAAVATRRHGIPDGLGDDLVVKPLGIGHYVDEAGVAQVVHATRMHRDDPRLDHLAGAPFIVQQHVAARAHYRLVTVDQNAWCCSIDATDLPVDWRADREAHDAFEPIRDRELERAAVRLAVAMGVRYSSQDWIVGPDGPAFIDLNPAGQWLFLPPPTAQEVTAAIASWLCEVDCEPAA